MSGKIKYAIFFILLGIVIITFFTKRGYRDVSEIVPEVKQEPIQEMTDTNNEIVFTRNDYRYEITPLYNYEINGLVVHEADYTLFSIYKRDSVFPIDLCMIWGDNVRDEVFKEEALKFSQDMRFCFAKWWHDIDFDMNQVSNNHLVAQSDELENRIKSINTGDQVKISGKLVNIVAENQGEAGEYDPEKFEWNSSTDREDSGAGACETILVEDVQILKKGNAISHILFKVSLISLIAFVILCFVLIFHNPFRRIDKD